MPRLPLLVVVLAVLATACSGTAQGAASDGFVAGDGAASVIAEAEREPAPDVSATTLDGETLALRDLEGPVVVNFWASWCGPCAKEAPALQNVADAYDGRVSFVGVNVKDQPAAARNFEQDFGVEYPSWEDEAASIAASFGGIGPAALPSTIVLDADHRVAARLFGAVDEPKLADHLDQVLGTAEEAG
jgi:thiol-disulfide isomerase/thioredoxin